VGEDTPLTNNISVRSCEGSAVDAAHMGGAALHSRVEESAAPVHAKAL